MEFLIFQLIILFFSVVLHELAHGYIADYLGDPTARLAQRLTLNPLKHFDLFGSFFVPLFFFLSNSPVILGWAKPVPYNPLLLTKDFKYGPLKIALGGPMVNLILALVFGLILRFSFSFLPFITIQLFSFIVYINLLLAIFNLMPIPPLDGSKILSLILPRRYFYLIESLGIFAIVFVFLFVFLFAPYIFLIINYLFGLITGLDFKGIF